MAAVFAPAFSFSPLESQGLPHFQQLAGGQLPVTPSWICRSQLVGFRHLPARHPHTRRYPILSLVPRLASSGPQGLVIAGLHIHDGPPKRPGGVGQRWPRRAITSFQNLPKNQKRTRWNALLVFPCCRSGATPLARWVFLFLAARFASPPYKPQGTVLCEASPGALPLIPSGRVHRRYTTVAFY